VDDPAPPRAPAPARRLVLFVADGLRAQSFYQPGLAPYIRETAGQHGILGLSHTRVPTESRPGHVAMLAGLYEDPSAITAGWSDNPVEFDHVLNRSSNGWAWGSPDIVPMFARGSVKRKGKVTVDSYTKEMENFAASNISQLDTWVFDKVESFFASALDNTTLQMKLREDGNVFFLHLLGCDTNGHVNKPHSEQYRSNINTVDTGVRKMVDVFEKYFRNDARTAYIMTADHGMTDWGSHGTGMDDETVTPFAMWGAGVKKLEENFGARSHFDHFDGFNHIKRAEMNQADLAPLMSALVGINIPVNNVGVLPVNLLDLHPNHKIEVMLDQIDQLLAQYLALKVKHQQVYFPNIFHRPFTKLGDDNIVRRRNEIKNIVKQGLFKEALRKCHGFIDDTMEGIDYYQRYQKNILLFLVKSCFIGCAILNLAKLTSNGRKTNSVMRRHSATIYTLISIVVSVVNFSWYCQKLPYHFLLYYVAPVFVWSKLIVYLITRTFHPLSLSRLNLLMILQVVAILLIIRESFFERKWLSLGFLTLLIHPIINSQIIPSNKCRTLTPDVSRTTFPFWLVSLAILALFPWLPVVDGRLQHCHLVLASGFLVSITSLYVYICIVHKEGKLNKGKLLLCVGPGLASTCVYYTSITPGLGLVTQVLTWLIFLLSTPIAITTRPYYMERTPFLCLALIASYNLLSLSYEALFLPMLCLTMAFWSKMEDTQSHNLYKKDDYFGSFLRNNREKVMKRSVTLPDVSCILSFLFIIFYSFFATGNIASLNSFDPSSIRCFVAIFSPLLMGGLLLIKILIPFLVVSLFFIQIVWFRGCEFGLVLNVLQMFCDILGLMFFNLVKNEGSWLEIGSSISHYVIVEGTTIFVVILLYFAAMISKIVIF